MVIIPLVEEEMVIISLEEEKTGYYTTGLRENQFFQHWLKRKLVNISLEEKKNGYYDTGLREN